MVLLRCKYGSKVAEAIAAGHESGIEHQSGSLMDQYNNQIGLMLAEVILWSGDCPDPRQIADTLRRKAEANILVTEPNDPRLNERGFRINR